MSVDPPRWSADHLSQRLAAAVERFRQQRMEESLEDYLEAFDRYRSAVENLLEMTADLSQISRLAAQVLGDPALQNAVRYLAGPPISAGDLSVLAETSLSPKALRDDPGMARRVIDLVLMGLDRNRFPWVAEDREPTDAERAAATMASAALIASRGVMTKRAGEANEAQESAVKEALRGAGLTEVPERRIRSLDEAPRRGQFCGESVLGTRKADLIVGLWDGRTMPVECKVSNSSVNSIKRLNNDAAAKAEDWLGQFGTLQIVPAAVLAGVFRLRNLQNAQERGLTLFWSHQLDELVQFVEQTRP